MQDTDVSTSRRLRWIEGELRRHAPFTTFGALTGAVLAVVFTVGAVPQSASYMLFWTLHPLHVLLSAVATTSMFRLHSRRNRLKAVLIGYIGSVGIATLSDSVIPYLGEWLLDLPNRGMHFGFIEKWWLVNPLALAGILVAGAWPRTRFPHAGHVLLSTWASLFHMTMALGSDASFAVVGLITIFLFVAVWLPCCTSDIVFPLLFAQEDRDTEPQQTTGHIPYPVAERDSAGESLRIER